ncbi:hypothetical protein H2O73_00520 [Vibrio sp. 404]|uniref:DUF4402 domain-containing protein n=1 Tax=Vibrio marinisediminis TaxID=2758441 RepID=A0A7W2FMR1_9VIBR|nr:hypothetical protein [Vibrio marinisediminis]MBA5760812.1 hypothetical protein [Vibrio marinisediminis]
MKYVAITAAILAVIGSSVVSAAPDVTAASTTLTKNIEPKCNIGLWAVGTDGSVGGDVGNGLGDDYVHSELNDLKTSGQSITGRAKCNSSGGFDVHVVATNGTLSNNDLSGNGGPRTVDYTLENNGSDNFDNSGGDFTSATNIASNTRYLVGSGVDTQRAEFKLLMKLAAGEEFTYAGQYTETLTFDLTPL